MGNNGSFGLQVEIEKIAMPADSRPKSLASKLGKVIDSYSFGLGQSSKLLLTSAYLNYAEGSRIKVSDQLNHMRTNLLKIVFVNDHVQVIEPEINLLSFFQKTTDSKKYNKIYSVVPSVQPVRSPHAVRGAQVR